MTKLFVTWGLHLTFVRNLMNSLPISELGILKVLQKKVIRLSEMKFDSIFVISFKGNFLSHGLFPACLSILSCIFIHYTTLNLICPMLFYGWPIVKGIISFEGNDQNPDGNPQSKKVIWDLLGNYCSHFKLIHFRSSFRDLSLHLYH